MRDKIFIDTNLLIYYISDDITKKTSVKNFLFGDVQLVISTQVISEFISVCIKKLKITKADAVAYSKDFMDIFITEAVSSETLKTAFAIMEKYGYSIWDSMIIASALDAKCNLLYSEDMQHGQVIDKLLTIKNPFKNGN
ncbi:MAG: PIN domain-containing protein [Victivallales bacterium]